MWKHFRACILTKKVTIEGLSQAMKPLRQSCQDYRYFMDYTEDDGDTTPWRRKNLLKGSCIDIDAPHQISYEYDAGIQDAKLFKEHRRRTQRLVDPLLNTEKYLIPALFKIDDQGKVEIISEINNLPSYQYGKTLYPLIASLFEKMIHSLEWILDDVKLQNKTIQVIVDIKRYQLLGGNISYRGVLHREGYREGEDIEAVGIYYFDITKNGFECDEFELHTATYVEGLSDSQYTKTIPIENEMILVFNNREFNHRLKELKTIETGGDDQVFERSIISFYIPRYKINSSKDIMVNGERYMIILSHWIREFDNKENSNNNELDCIRNKCDNMR